MIPPPPPGYRPIFKIAIFGNETWPLGKVPEVAHTLSFYPWGRIELIFSLRPALSEILVVFKIDIFGHEAFPLAKVPEVVHALSFYPKGRN